MLKRLTQLVILTSPLWTSLNALGKSKGLRPGIDISESSSFTLLSFENYCRSSESDAGECWSPSEPMGSTGYSFSVFLQKPLESRRIFKVFHLDYGATLPMLFYNLTNDPDQNTAGAYSTDAEGNIIRSREVPIDAVFLGLQPTLYVQAGLTIPYMPWMLVSLGGGPEFLYGKLKVDGHKEVTFQSLGAPGLYVEFEISLLRTQAVNLSAYAKILASDKKDKLKVMKGDDLNYRIESSNVSNLGIRIHFP